MFSNLNEKVVFVLLFGAELQYHLYCYRVQQQIVKLNHGDEVHAEIVLPLFRITQFSASLRDVSNSTAVVEDEGAIERA